MIFKNNDRLINVYFFTNVIMLVWLLERSYLRNSLVIRGEKKQILDKIRNWYGIQGKWKMENGMLLDVLYLSHIMASDTWNTKYRINKRKLKVERKL